MFILFSGPLPEEIVTFTEKHHSSEITLSKSVNPVPLFNDPEGIQMQASNVADPIDHTNNGQPRTITGQSQKSSPQDISKMVTSVISEEREKEKQRLNLIIHIMKESQGLDLQKGKNLI